MDEQSKSMEQTKNILIAHYRARPSKINHMTTTTEVVVDKNNKGDIRAVLEAADRRIEKEDQQQSALRQMGRRLFEFMYADLGIRDPHMADAVCREINSFYFDAFRALGSPDDGKGPGE